MGTQDAGYESEGHGHGQKRVLRKWMRTQETCQETHPSKVSCLKINYNHASQALGLRGRQFEGRSMQAGGVTCLEIFPDFHSKDQ